MGVFILTLGGVKDVHIDIVCFFFETTCGLKKNDGVLTKENDGVWFHF